MESPPSEVFRLALTPQAVEALCASLWQQFRGPGQILSALVAIQSLLALAPPGDRETEPYRNIQALIARHAETARAQLLAECESRLLLALERRDTAEITRVHGSLSRNGFWQAAAAARGRENSDLAWLAQWCNSARAKAEAASGYPDALDFRAAGLVAEEYAAMQELLRCLRTE